MVILVKILEGFDVFFRRIQEIKLVERLALIVAISVCSQVDNNLRLALFSDGLVQLNHQAGVCGRRLQVLV